MTTPSVSLREQIKDKLDRMHPYASSRLTVDEALEAILQAVRGVVETEIDDTYDPNTMSSPASETWNEAIKAVLDKLA